MARPARKIEAHEQDLGTPEERKIEITDDGPELSENVIDVVKSHDFKKKAEIEAFMHEPVEIRVIGTGAPNEEQIVYVGVNGKTEFFMRDVPKVTKRMFVDKLARAKRITFREKRNVDPEGNITSSYPATYTLKYPFELIKDTEKGRTWLNTVLSQKV